MTAFPLAQVLAPAEGGRTPGREARSSHAQHPSRGGRRLALSLGRAATACGGGPRPGDGSNDSAKTLTYWASNQGTSLDNDKQVLQPELDKFEQQTGIKVNLEVVRWSDLLNRILAATTSGQGPDVLNIGNTWSASLQATGALLPVRRRRLAKSAARTGSSPPRSPPPARPASRRPPCRCTPWRTRSTTTRRCSPTPASPSRRRPGELVADGKKLTKDGKWGLAHGGREAVGEHPPRLHLRRAARRRVLRLAAGKPTSPPQHGRGDQAVHRPHGRRQGHHAGQRRVRAEPVASPTSPTARRR